MAHVEPLALEVAYAPRAGEVDLRALVLPAGSTVAAAVEASGVLLHHGVDASSVKFGVWGKLREPTHVLRDRDRVEIYRGLLVDPKEARRQRYQQHKEKLALRQR